MFEDVEEADARGPTSGPRGALGAADIRTFASSLTQAGGSLSDAERIEMIRCLEELTGAAAAAQATLTVDLDASQRQAQADAGVPAHRQGAGIASQIALARRESPVRGAMHLGLGKALVHEMPHTRTALAEGRLSEHRAMLLVRETACLSRAHRRKVDDLVCGGDGAFDGLGDKRLIALVRDHAYALDPHSVVERNRRAVTQRRVTTRPAPDQMGYVTALLPMTQAVAVHATLTRDADALKAAGDERSRGQIMADLLHDRITGLCAASGTPVKINLTMTDRALLASGNEPAHLAGYGTIPAACARDLVHAALTTKLADPETGELRSETAVWVTRVFTHPTTGQLLAMDSRSRTAPAGLADLVDIRDGGICRTPWCNAPIRHHDHPDDWATGGQTSETNQQGLCAGCNYTKQAPGWTADGTHPHPGEPGPGRHQVATTTPTGHTYTSHAPAPPGTPPDPYRSGHLRIDFTRTA